MRNAIPVMTRTIIDRETMQLISRALAIVLNIDEQIDSN